MPFPDWKPQPTKFTEKRIRKMEDEHAELKRRYKQSCITLREMKDSQKRNFHEISPVSFKRMVKQVLDLVHKTPNGLPTRDTLSDLNMSKIALEILQEDAESFITEYFYDATECTLHGNRITLGPADMKLVERLKDPHRHRNLK